MTVYARHIFLIFIQHHGADVTPPYLQDNASPFVAAALHGHPEVLSQFRIVFARFRVFTHTSTLTGDAVISRLRVEAVPLRHPQSPKAVFAHGPGRSILLVVLTARVFRLSRFGNVLYS